MTGLGFDHVGLIVTDLERARGLCEALGFRLSARADHTMTNAQGQTVSAGSSQHTVMLREGYVELMQITDPSAGHPLSAAPSVRCGLHVLALSVRDAQAAHAQLSAAALRPGADSSSRVGALRHWARPIDEPDRQGLARFAFFDAPWKPTDPSYFCFVEHLTPELVRAPSDTIHANGAQAVTGVCYAGPLEQVAAFARRLAAFGMPARPDRSPLVSRTLRRSSSAAASGAGSDNPLPALRIDLGTTALTLEIDPEAERLVPIALELRVAELDPIAARCRALGLACTVLDGSAAVAGAASGAGLAAAAARLAIDLTEVLGVTLIART